MFQVIGPSHHACYNSLKLRIRFALAMAQGLTLSPSVLSMLKRMEHLFHIHDDHSSLENVLDDTPIDSFLRNVSDQVDAMEYNLFGAMQDLADHSKEVLSQRARFFGRLLGQDTISSGLLADPHSTDGPTALFLLRSFLSGGEWLQKFFLIRRVTTNELNYECLLCPHERLDHIALENRHWACFLEAQLYKGFYETVWPRAHYEREHRPYHCVDFVSNHL